MGHSEPKDIFDEIRASVEVVNARKADLDAASMAVQAASDAYEQAQQAADEVSKRFLAAVGSVVPSLRVR